MGDRWQSLGTRAIDVGWSPSGLANVGLDTVTARADADWNGDDTVSLNMEAGQRIVFNAVAAPLDGIAYYGNVPGSAYDAFSRSGGVIARCNGGSCWNVGRHNLTASVARESGAISIISENTDQTASSTASIEARVGSTRVAMVAQGDGARFSTEGRVLAVEVQGKEIMRFDEVGVRHSGAVAFQPPITTACRTLRYWPSRLQSDFH